MNIQTYLDHQAILANHAHPIHLAIRLTAAAITAPRPKPAAFCVVIDRSGSMSGEPLARAKEAAAVAVRNLRPGDYFALTVFESQAQTVIPLQPAERKPEFLAKITQISSAGSTNLTAGWMLGRDQLREAPVGASRRVVLLSDGHLNVGITEPGAVHQIVASGMERDGIRTSCLGFGADYDENLMAELARVTNGQFHDASSPEKFPGIFAAELDGLQKLAVQNVRLRLRKLDFCDALTPLGEYVSVTLPDGRTEYAIGDLVSDEERLVCFGVQVLPLPAIDGQPAFTLEGEQLLALEILYDELQADGVASRTFAQTIRIRATQDPGEVRLNGEVVQWVAVQRAGVVTDEVTRLLDAKRIQEALALLERTLIEMHAWDPGPGVDDAVRVLKALCKRIISGDWDERARKSAKYLSHSYRKMSSKEIWSHDDEAPKFKRSPPPPPPKVDPSNLGGAS